MYPRIQMQKGKRRSQEVMLGTIEHVAGHVQCMLW